MTIFNSQQQNHRAIRWRGIAATGVVELLVLLALGVAVVRYLEWSSAVNQAEFMIATELPASVANHSGDYQWRGRRPHLVGIEFFGSNDTASFPHSIDSFSI